MCGVKFADRYLPTTHSNIHFIQSVITMYFCFIILLTIMSNNHSWTKDIIHKILKFKNFSEKILFQIETFCVCALFKMYVMASFLKEKFFFFYDSTQNRVLRRLMYVGFCFYFSKNFKMKLSNFNLSVF
jgi:ABC-type uncharacterized transport system permease subunit